MSRHDEMPSESSNDLTTLDILHLDDSELIPVVIPEWKKNGRPGRVYLKVLTADEMIRFNDMLSNPAQKKEALVRLVAYGMCDAAGKRLMSDEQLTEFRKRSIKIFLRLQNLIMEHNGLKDDDEKKAKTDAERKND